MKQVKVLLPKSLVPCCIRIAIDIHSPHAMMYHRMIYHVKCQRDEKISVVIINFLCRKIRNDVQKKKRYTVVKMLSFKYDIVIWYTNYNLLYSFQNIFACIYTCYSRSSLHVYTFLDRFDSIH